MKKAFAAILALLLCVLLTGCGPYFSDFYEKTATEYLTGIDSMTLDEARTVAENNGLEFVQMLMGNCEVSYSSSESIRLKFNGNTLVTAEYRNLDEKITIFVSASEIYYVNPESPTRWNVDSLAYCEEKVFGKKSGADFAVKKGETSSYSSTSTTSSSSSYSTGTTPSYTVVTLRYGKLLDKQVTGNSLIIKAKISPSYNNKATVDQNYYNIEDIIKKQGGDKFTEIQYWAVADMSDGSEQKVVSFTVSQNIIKKIANDEIVANQMGNYVDDLFIHQSLR